MSRFHGFCSFPHGICAIGGLIVSSLFALAATMWGMASCRYMYIEYTTDRGDFGDFYLDPTADGEPVTQRVGAGLFTWLEPFTNIYGTDIIHWSNGQCSGYSEGQREFFADTTFEVARVFAVLSVIGGMSSVLAMILLSCISFVRFQIWILSTILMMLAVSNCLTFIIFQSKLCNDLVSYQNESYSTQCTIDQGGLIVIAGAIFWSVACLISVVFIKDPRRDLSIKNGKITNKFDARQERRNLREKERKVNAALHRERKKQEIDQRRQRKNNQELSDRKSVV